MARLRHLGFATSRSSEARHGQLRARSFCYRCQEKSAAIRHERELWRVRPQVLDDMFAHFAPRAPFDEAARRIT